MEAAGNSLAGKICRGLYNRGVNIKADSRVSSLDALCAWFSAQTAPLRNNAPLMDDDFTGDVSTREHRPMHQQQVPSNRAAGGAPDDPGGDSDDDNDGCSEVKSHLGSHLLTPESRLYTQHTNRHPEVASSNTMGEGDGCKGKLDL
jgi:hypothetical protein